MKNKTVGLVIDILGMVLAFAAMIAALRVWG